MRRLSWPVVFPLLTCVAAAFGVFVLPFFFPPAFTAAVSVSNAAGFNNKLAAVAAAACAVLVFAISVRNRSVRSNEPLSTQPDQSIHSHSNLPAWVWIAAALLLSTLIAFAAWQVHVSGLMYPGDVGYLVNQMRSNAVYHRSLYAQIEFPYGPLLFYPPILLHSALRYWHTSLQTCYFLILVLNQFLGILLLGYAVSGLRIRRNWQIFILCCFVPFALQPMLGLNYTWLRFIMPFATLLFCTAQKNLWITSVLLCAGVVLNLATSPEMGFAFAAAVLTYASLQIRSKGPKWALALLSVPIGGAAFLLFVGSPYFRMLGLFAGGEYNFIVEPLPHVLLYLVALIWLIPRLLATRFPRLDEHDIVLASFFVTAVSLTPVALGRSDPGHVFFDGMGIFLLSFVAISHYKQWQQITWGTLFAATMLFGYSREIHIFRGEFQQVLYKDALDHPNWLTSRVVVRAAKAAGSQYLLKPNTVDPDESFNVDDLSKITGGQSVATPFSISLRTEQLLRWRGLYRPDFYFSSVAILDRRAEEQKIQYLEIAAWALLPTSEVGGSYTETQATADSVMGISLPYRSGPNPFFVGKLLSADLQYHWQPVAELGPYTVYRKRSIP